MTRTVTVQVPGDKSITHRALLLASLAEGTSRILAPLDAADTRSTRHAVELLGIRVEDTAGGLLVHGRGLDGWSAPASPIDCGNSGTTARLLMGGLAGRPFSAELRGDASLQSRPMTRVIEPLTTMGAAIAERGIAGRLPVRIQGGALGPIHHHNVQSSAQVKSALLLAALTGDAAVSVSEPRLSRDHTERMLHAAGVPLQRSMSADGHRVSLDGRHVVHPLDLTIPGDFSSAAFFIACALLSADSMVLLPDVGLNPGRTGMLDVLRRMNGTVEVRNERIEAGEPVGDVCARSSTLAGVDIAPAEVPSLIDEIPVIAALAACAEGETRIAGAGELRVKETDRIRALVQNLRGIGAHADERPDGLVITGTTRPLRGTVKTFGDHRIAMAFGVLGLLAGNDIVIDEPDVVAVSFPGFWEAMDRVRAAGAVA